MSQSLLIHGGDTPAGRLGIQFARRSGLRVLATRVGGGGGSNNARAGGENNKDGDEEEALRALGAAAVFDAAAAACAAEIRARADDRLTLAWDCTGGAGAALCAGALSSTESGVYYASPTLATAAASSGRDVVDPAAPGGAAAAPREWPAAVAAAVGARVYHDAEADADPEVAEEARELARGFWLCAETLLGSGDVTGGSLAVNRGGAGLEGVLRGLEAGTGEGGSLCVYTL